MNLQKKNTKSTRIDFRFVIGCFNDPKLSLVENSPIGDSIMRYNELFNDGYQFKFEFKPIDDEFSKTYYTIIKDS